MYPSVRNEFISSLNKFPLGNSPGEILPAEVPFLWLTLTRTLPLIGEFTRMFQRGEFNEGVFRKPRKIVSIYSTYFYYLHTVNDRLSPRVLICQNHFQGLSWVLLTLNILFVDSVMLMFFLSSVMNQNIWTGYVSRYNY